MIKDKLANASIYYELSNNLKKGFEWLKSTDLNLLEDGKYLIDGDDVYASVQTYKTKENALYEAHRKYIDIQTVIEGVEKIGVASLSECSSSVEYNTEKDIEFYNYNNEEEFLTLKKGDFVVLYPTDAHKPSITKDKQVDVRKIVIKVAI